MRGIRPPLTHHFQRPPLDCLKLSGQAYFLFFSKDLSAQEAGLGGHILIGYILGLGVVQYAISVGAGWVVYQVWKATEAAAVQARLTGAVVAGVGLFLTMENAEGLMFQMMGLSS